MNINFLRRAILNLMKSLKCLMLALTLFFTSMSFAQKAQENITAESVNEVVAV